MNNMAGKPYSLRAFLFLSKTLLTKAWNKLYFQRKSTNLGASQSQFHKGLLLANGEELISNTISVFHVEGALLKSSSVFPYFMLVAFEAGGPLRALILLLLCPILCLVSKDLGMKIMVFVCFVGLKERSFRIGRSVLPKFFLEDVGDESFGMVMKCGRKIAVSDMPRVMVEGFLQDYLRVDTVVGRELKVVCGHFVGLMEEKNHLDSAAFFDEKKPTDSNVIGIGSFDIPLHNYRIFSHCQAVYLVSEAEKRHWKALPREKYPRPLIFHDGRLAFRPTPLATMFMFMWIPVGLLLFIIRSSVALLLPYKLSIPILSFTGLKGTLARPNTSPNSVDAKGKAKGVLYVCNHRTLLDPIYVSMALKKPATALVYSVSWISELFSPIKTVRLTRNREQDSKLIEKQLSQGDLIICPEGTTCREPYLLRFSPLFAEISKEIVPFAIDFKVSMFYGTTASGFKWLDPVFLLLNPYTHCSGGFLEKLPESITSKGGERSKFEVANYVQAQIAKALRFECTSLTRKDKYMILAGNEGLI